MKTNWEKPRAHVHYAKMLSSIERGHQHGIDFFVFPVTGSSYDGHVHFYRGFSELERGHAHRFYGYTGPAIPLPDGTHYHELSGQTYLNYTTPLPVQIGGETYIEGVQYNPQAKDVHRHAYAGYTGRPVGYEPEGW
ncbi:YmaF family protein [Paenibacillus hamazuiensis]|uniref:YmaF family protein n=1 Tax=Paenibacillus hamazuiensis TaxID=2936508 RepID=UPI00200C1888|nr:YmaF family protein [Paenibacillus hamazuiensis]